ncbi:UDP-3-O-[3-hydroxymyristoyl] glucosamine N-acyltransferase [Candidatus Termititenax aidoneus]|uniref:UDP-3-O-[3-hydroxymyristoyl] glucosamine N-acyltransferase n=1 Tax=Termititenax aidoneus TaxID=2218524 RepID=A0A388TD17_TERA1|nr:UDP-3-O-[3-hydroxymyristoyl] glucosamine N-acyltransferase [Candidatus Termititenax aidoneus]
MLTAQALAEKIGGQLIGQDIPLKFLVEAADCARAESVCLGLARKTLTALKEQKPNCLILNKDLPEFSCPKIITAKGKEVLIDLLNIFYPEPEKTGVSEKAFVDPTAVIGQDVTIYPQAFVGRQAVIGDNTILYAGAVVYADCVIGKNCIVHANAVIGADGFGYVQDEDGRQLKVPQRGRVIIEDDVEIGANTCIDRATISATVIGQGTKIDNKVHIAHNVKIGKNCILVGASNVAGSSTLGDNVVLAGNAGVGDNISIGSNTVIFASTSVLTDIPPNSKIYGTPTADDYGVAMRRRALYNKLPEIYERLKKLEEKDKQISWE